jgi:SAM-dependent methyltransferase
VPDCDTLLAEAEAHPVAGWDFSWLGNRLEVVPLPWDYDAIVAGRARASPDLLDLGTGGGEWLARLPHRPGRTVATESWEPNVAVAARRLEPLGVRVVAVEAARDNAEQDEREAAGSLPLTPSSFHLVSCRHEAYVAAEVARVLVPGGYFVTQQVGGRYDDFYRLLGLTPPAPPVRRWSLALAVEQLAASGLRVTQSAEAEQVSWFADVGALAWYLFAVPWAVPGFSPQQHRDALERLHARVEADGPVPVAQPAFWLEARKQVSD